MLQCPQYFTSDVQISFCNWSPLIEHLYVGMDGLASFLPFLGTVLAQSTADVSVPMEEAEEDSRQVFVSFSNTCTLTLLFDDENRVARIHMLCAKCRCCD